MALYVYPPAISSIKKRENTPAGIKGKLVRIITAWVWMRKSGGGRKEKSRVLKSEKDGWACGDRKKGKRKMRKKRTAWSKTRGK